LEIDAEAWNLQIFEFRAPGATPSSSSAGFQVTPNATAVWFGRRQSDSSDPSGSLPLIELIEPPIWRWDDSRARDVTLGSDVMREFVTASRRRNPMPSRTVLLSLRLVEQAYSRCGLERTDVDV